MLLELWLHWCQWKHRFFIFMIKLSVCRVMHRDSEPFSWITLQRVELSDVKLCMHTQGPKRKFIYGLQLLSKNILFLPKSIDILSNSVLFLSKNIIVLTRGRQKHWGSILFWADSAFWNLSRLLVKDIHSHCQLRSLVPKHVVLAGYRSSIFNNISSGLSQKSLSLYDNCII